MIRISVISLILLFTADVWPQESTHLVFDMPCNDSLPIHYRKSNGKFQTSAENTPDTTGLALLNASGSAEFCLKSLGAMIKDIDRKKITIVDLREESHGFVNGSCVSWDGFNNLGNSREVIEADETHRLDSLLKAKKVSVYHTDERGKVKDESGPMFIEVSRVQSESELVSQFNAGYFRITVTDRKKPQNEKVDRFVEFINTLPADMWLHFHCQAGYGRTTTFLAMYDMMRNSKKVSLHDILQRQYLLGGIDLLRIDESPQVDKKDGAELKEFLSNFYEYCLTSTDNFRTSFTEWISVRKD